MKGSLAAMVVAAERFVAQHPNHTGRLAFLITSDEEARCPQRYGKVVEALMARNEASRLLSGWRTVEYRSGR